jgi:tight adherence protein B
VNPMVFLAGAAVLCLVLPLAGAGSLTGPALALAVGAGALLRRSANRGSARERRRRTEVEALRALAAEVAAGAALPAALAIVADDLLGAPPGRQARDDLLPALLAEAGRAPDEHAGARTLQSSDAPGIRGLGAAWHLSAESGAPLAGSLLRLAATASAAAATAHEVRSTLAGPRLTARLLAVLPLGGIGMAVLSGAHPVDVLLHTAVGQVCLLTGTALDVAGLLWIERLASAAEP